MPTPEELREKYKARLNKELGIRVETVTPKIISREYKEFKKTYLSKKFTLYEKACAVSEKILNLKPDPKKAALIQEDIDTAHLDITPAGATSFSILAPMILIFIGALFSFAVFNSVFFVMIFVMTGAVLVIPLGKLPSFIANDWRLKGSNQMVICIFYVVTFMRHTSNLELAIKFASENLAPPLSLDLRKVLWDVETEKYSTIKESLDLYLEGWRKWNVEFIEAFHLIESSLYEPSEERRLTLLDKSLDVILTETYEKMLHYAHNLGSPITMLHMLGVILPILGLVILPLIVNFMGEVKWYHLAVFYNVLLPVGVFFFGKSILAKRPTGYGDTDISEDNPELKKYRNVIIKIAGLEIQINPLMISIVVGVVFFLIGISPLLMHLVGVGDFGFGGDDVSSPCGLKYCMLGYRGDLGPYGLGASILSLFVVLSIGIPVGLYYKLRSKNIIKIRQNAKKLENEFASALFQLGNRLGDGLPAEIAFGKVSEVMKESLAGKFFSIVDSNIRNLGMSVKDAIYNKRTGALIYFPSRIIDSSMSVLIQSIKKGPKIAAQALTNISRYIKEIHKVNERLKDLMAEIISSMQAQIKFMAPAIAGIVIGITSMVTTIIGKLSSNLSRLASEGGGGPQANVLSLFGDGIPTYYFQIVVGTYIVQIIYILTVLSNGIENGADKLTEKYNLGNNMIRSVIMYCFIAMSVMLLFNIIAARILTVSQVG